MKYSFISHLAPCILLFMISACIRSSIEKQNFNYWKDKLGGERGWEVKRNFPKQIFIKFARSSVKAFLADRVRPIPFSSKTFDGIAKKGINTNLFEDVIVYYYRGSPYTFPPAPDMQNWKNWDKRLIVEMRWWGDDGRRHIWYDWKIWERPLLLYPDAYPLALESLY